MNPAIKRIASDEKLPEAVDVVVVGGGIIGTCSAYVLAKRGLSVALLEKGYLGCEQSSRTWGWCRKQNRDRREMPLAMLSMDMWDAFAGEIGKDVGFRRTGLIYATDNEKELAGWASWRSVAEEFNVDTHMLTAAQAAEFIPENRRQWVGGLHSVADGRGAPEIAVPTIAEGARALGATIHQECAARGLDIANGRVIGVETERGLIRCDAVVCAGGAWASRFVKPHGVVFPQASVRQTAMRTRPMENLGEVLYCPDFAMTRRDDGSYTVAISGRATLEVTPQGIRYFRQFLPQFIQRLKAVQLTAGKSFFTGPDSLGSVMTNDPLIFEKNRVLDPDPNPRLMKEMVRNVSETWPDLAGFEIDHAWGAFVDCTPDAIPVISKVDKLGGLVIAAGSSGHGFGLGPGIAALAGELATNEQPSVDATPFRLQRFGDGSSIEVGAI
ncbi:MAG: FAD-binding oxidoreductase [Novosphingobium sp.]|nr:FAD-binding oxidoreductase [Novosphingobium sp.]